MFKCKLKTEMKQKQVAVYVAKKSLASKSKPSFKKISVKINSRRMTLGWYYTGDAGILNHLLML